MARIAVDEHSPPFAMLTWLEKKYFSSKIPRGVCMYFWVVTLDMVDSCISMASAMSRRTIGFMCSSPCSRKSCCCSTISEATLSKAVFQELVIPAVISTLDHAGIVIIDPDLWGDIAIERNLPLPLVFSDQYIDRDVFGWNRVYCATRAWIQLLYERYGLLNQCCLNLELFCNTRIVAPA